MWKATAPNLTPRFSNSSNGYACRSNFVSLYYLVANESYPLNNMFIPFSHLGDAFGAAPITASSAKAHDSVMVASTDGSIFGSYPFVTSFPVRKEDPIANNGYAWQLVPVYNEDEARAIATSNEAQLWKRNEVARYHQFPYKIIKSHASSKKTHGCVSHGQAVCHTEKTPQASKCDHRNAVNKSTVGVRKCKKHSKDKHCKNRFEGAKTIDAITIKDLEDIIKKELRNNVLPTLRIEPSHNKTKINRQAIKSHREKIARAMSHEIVKIVEAVDPAHLVNIVLEGTKHAHLIKNTWKKKTKAIATKLMHELCEEGFLPHKNIHKKNKNKSKKKNPHDASQDEIKTKPHLSVAETQFECRIPANCFMTKTIAKSTIKKPRVSTVTKSEHESSKEIDQPPALISFDDPQAHEDPNRQDSKEFARMPSGPRHLAPPVTNDPSNFPTAPGSDTSAIKRVKLHESGMLQEMQQGMQEIKTMFTTAMKTRDKEPTQDRKSNNNSSQASHETPDAQNSKDKEKDKKTRSVDQDKDDGSDKSNPPSSFSSDSSNSDSSSCNSDSDDTSDNAISLPPMPDPTLDPAETDAWLTLRQSGKKLQRMQRKARKK